MDFFNPHNLVKEVVFITCNLWNKPCGHCGVWKCYIYYVQSNCFYDIKFICLEFIAVFSSYTAISNKYVLYECGNLYYDSYLHNQYTVIHRQPVVCIQYLWIIPLKKQVPIRGIELARLGIGFIGEPL